MSSEAKTGKLGRADDGFDPAAYAPVAERISLFYGAFPSGRIVTELVSRTERECVFRALIYRGPDDREPAATGWAAEREGDGDVNAVACLENTETSAIGRALANLGFTASRQRPSAEEMAKASRARAIALRERGPHAMRDRAVVTDMLLLLARAERAGLRAERARRWRARLGDGVVPREQLTRFEQRLRLWIAKQRHGAIS